MFMLDKAKFLQWLSEPIKYNLRLGTKLLEIKSDIFVRAWFFIVLTLCFSDDRCAFGCQLAILNRSVFASPQQNKLYIHSSFCTRFLNWILDPVYCIKLSSAK
jgi:hypothetical protein